MWLAAMLGVLGVLGQAAAQINTTTPAPHEQHGSKPSGGTVSAPNLACLSNAIVFVCHADRLCADCMLAQPC